VSCLDTYSKEQIFLYVVGVRSPVRWASGDRPDSSPCRPDARSRNAILSVSNRFADIQLILVVYPLDFTLELLFNIRDSTSLPLIKILASNLDIKLLDNHANLQFT
jgi:hypothetical protein